MKTRFLLLICTFLALTIGSKSDEPARPELRVHQTQDFKVTGDGSAQAWEKADWQSLHRRTAEDNS